MDVQWNKIVRYVVIGAATVAVSEIIYMLYVYIRKKYDEYLDAISINEVIFVNELTETCATNHQNNRAYSRPDNKIIQQSSSPQSPTLPCSNRFCAFNNIGRVVKHIDSAKHSIDMAMYTFTSFDLSRAMQRARSRGVTIRIISDKEMVYSSGSQIIHLTKQEIAVRCPNTTMLMHHKYVVIDGPHRVAKLMKKRKYDPLRIRSILLTGSLNWTMQGFGGNWENIVITSNRQLSKQYEDEFERMWQAFTVS